MRVAPAGRPRKAESIRQRTHAQPALTILPGQEKPAATKPPVGMLASSRRPSLSWPANWTRKDPLCTHLAPRLHCCNICVAALYHKLHDIPSSLPPHHRIPVAELPLQDPLHPLLSALLVRKEDRPRAPRGPDPPLGANQGQTPE